MMTEENNSGKGIAQALRGLYGYGSMGLMSEAELISVYAALGITPKSGLAPDFSDVAVRERILKNPTGLPSD